MNRLKHIKEKAIELRKRGTSLNDLCNMLGMKKTTVYYWIKDVVVEDMNAFIKNNKEKIKKSALAASYANRAKYNKIHETYKCKAVKIWVLYKNNRSFREFIMGYICEGYKKTKHVLSICNSDPLFMTFNKKWFDILNFHKKKLEYTVQIHKDQNEEEIYTFWKNSLAIEENIRIIQKSNSGNLKKRNWNCLHGVLSIRISDAYLKTMLDVWIDSYKKEFVESISPIVIT